MQCQSSILYSLCSVVLWDVDMRADIITLFIIASLEDFSFQYTHTCTCTSYMHTYTYAHMHVYVHVHTYSFTLCTNVFWESHR